jgi:glycosyltransferase involved in cell wall biosynthesis
LDDFFPVVIFTKPPGALLIYDTSHWCDEGAVTQISVIVPSFNQGRFIEETLQSVLLQGYPELQLVVMDGGSNDDTVNVLQKYDHRLEAWVSERDRGQAHAFNKGLKHVTGEIIGWLNSDDIYLNQCLFGAAEYFFKHQDVDIVFSDYIYIDENGHYLRGRKEPRFHYSTYLWAGDCFHANCAGFFRRKVFDRIGELDETLHFGMDYEFYLRAGKAGVRFGHVRTYWGGYRLHQASKSVVSHDLQLVDASRITTRYRPATVGLAGAELRTVLFATLRIIRKAFLGSYLLRKPDLVAPAGF